MPSGSGEPPPGVRTSRLRARSHSSIAFFSDAPQARAYARTLRALGTARADAARCRVVAWHPASTASCAYECPLAERWSRSHWASATSSRFEETIGFSLRPNAVPVRAR
ncbi:hypothetical protein GCM10009566_74160 [Streptomyces murinus]